MEDAIISRPYDTVGDLVETFKVLVKGTFLDQTKVPITNNTLNVKEFSCYVTGSYSSIEVGLLHEIAHAVQLKRSDYPRLKRGSFFKQPRSSTNTVLGRTYYEPSSSEPTIRECEVFAIQLVLLEHLRYEIDHTKYCADVVTTLTSGAMADYNKHQAEMCEHLVRGFYYAWRDKLHLIERRFNNFCEYVSKLS